MKEMQAGIYIERNGTDGTYKPSRRRMACYGMDEAMNAVCALYTHEIGDVCRHDCVDITGDVCVCQCVTAAMGAMWCAMPDPKGVGVLTTRRRYSRERHRQKSAFSSHPLGYSYPLSIINP